MANEENKTAWSTKKPSQHKNNHEIMRRQNRNKIEIYSKLKIKKEFKRNVFIMIKLKYCEHVYVKNV